VLETVLLRERFVRVETTGGITTATLRYTLELQHQKLLVGGFKPSKRRSDDAVDRLRGAFCLNTRNLSRYRVTRKVSNLTPDTDPVARKAVK
jgi:uncharacterized linocin/CFP29 family protein